MCLFLVYTSITCLHVHVVYIHAYTLYTCVVLVDLARGTLRMRFLVYIYIHTYIHVYCTVCTCLCICTLRSSLRHNNIFPPGNICWYCSSWSCLWEGPQWMQRSHWSRRGRCGGTTAEPGQPPAEMERCAGEHWAGPKYIHVYVVQVSAEQSLSIYSGHILCTVLHHCTTCTCTCISKWHWEFRERLQSDSGVVRDTCIVMEWSIVAVGHTIDWSTLAESIRLLDELLYYIYIYMYVLKHSLVPPSTHNILCILHVRWRGRTRDEATQGCDWHCWLPRGAIVNPDH